MNQRRVDLAQFDTTAPDLDLIIAAAAEDQALAFQPHQIAAAVGPRPAQRRHRPVLLGVFVGVEVAGQADAADDQLTHLPVAHRLAVGIDHGQVPARQRQADAHRACAVQPGRTCDHGGLGRAVGIPDLPAVDGEPCGQLRGHASPPKINSRTASSASAGQSAASVGTVDTTVTSRVTSHGPRSIPLRTSDRGAGIRHAPCRHASHISSHDASNATDKPASTRSPGPMGLSCRNICASASTNAAALRCVTATPWACRSNRT